MLQFEVSYLIAVPSFFIFYITIVIIHITKKLIIRTNNLYPVFIIVIHAYSTNHDE